MFKNKHDQDKKTKSKGVRRWDQSRLAGSEMTADKHNNKKAAKSKNPRYSKQTKIHKWARIRAGAETWRERQRVKQRTGEQTQKLRELHQGPQGLNTQEKTGQQDTGEN